MLLFWKYRVQCDEWISPIAPHDRWCQNLNFRPHAANMTNIYIIVCTCHVYKSRHHQRKMINSHRAHHSTALLYPLLWMISGARYSGVPHNVHVLSVSFFAKPKSVIFRWPSFASSKFSGLRSRYTMFRAWRYSRADTISAA